MGWQGGQRRRRATRLRARSVSRAQRTRDARRRRPSRLSNAHRACERTRGRDDGPHGDDGPTRPGHAGEARALPRGLRLLAGGWLAAVCRRMRNRCRRVLRGEDGRRRVAPRRAASAHQLRARLWRRSVREAPFGHGPDMDTLVPRPLQIQVRARCRYRAPSQHKGRASEEDDASATVDRREERQVVRSVRLGSASRRSAHPPSRAAACRRLLEDGGCQDLHLVRPLPRRLGPPLHPRRLRASSSPHVCRRNGEGHRPQRTADRRAARRMASHVCRRREEERVRAARAARRGRPSSRWPRPQLVRHGAARVRDHQTGARGQERRRHAGLGAHRRPQLHDLARRGVRAARSDARLQRRLRGAGVPDLRLAVRAGAARRRGGRARRDVPQLRRAERGRDDETATVRLQVAAARADGAPHRTAIPL